MKSARWIPPPGGAWSGEPARTLSRRPRGPPQHDRPQIRTDYQCRQRGGDRGIGYVSAYGVSKTALIRLTETLADETRPYGITVLAAHPGTVRTPMSEYARTSPHVAELAQPVQAWFEHLFETQLIRPLRKRSCSCWPCGGFGDTLSGCYLDVDADLAALTAQAAAIQAEKRYTLRLQA